MLESIDFEDRFAKVQKRYKEFENEKEALSWTQRNKIRRELHCENELIRLDIELKVLERDHKVKDSSVTNDSSYDPQLIEEAFTKLNSIRNQIGLEISPADHSILARSLDIARLICFYLWMFGIFFVLLFCIPIRFTHPLLRRLGIRNNYLPFDIIQWIFCRGLLCIAGIEVRTENVKNMSESKVKDATICMFSHGSNLDGMIIQSFSPITLKFIAKKSIFLIPIVGWVSRWGFGGVPIDRSNRRNALRSLKYLASVVDDWGRSIAISPEGTRSKTGQILDFKKGPFYLQEDANKPITPVVLFGAYELYPPSRIFTLPGKVVLRFLPQFVPDPAKSRDENRLELRPIFLLEQLKAPIEAGLAPETNSMILCYLSLPLVLFFFRNLVNVIAAAFDLMMLYFSLSSFGVVGLWMMLGIFLEVVMYISC